MRTRKIGRDAALGIVRKERERVRPNAGFWEQLGIWEGCGYEVWEVVGGVRKEKAAYAEWKLRAEEEMRKRILGFE